MDSHNPLVYYTPSPDNKIYLQELQLGIPVSQEEEVLEIVQAEAYFWAVIWWKI